ncbi:MAG: redoxin family protein [Candidatus Micrarchaeaceae archaeon]
MIIAFAVVIAIAAIALLNSYAQGKAATYAAGLRVGTAAPDLYFSTAGGSSANVSAYKGNTIVLWFVATWCSGCAEGNLLLNSNYALFKQKGIKVVELELYNDLGYNGPSIMDFVKTYAPAAYASGVVIPAYASYNMTLTYDAKGYLDVYYLIAPNGKILYTNSPLASTFSQLAEEINAT